MQPGADARERFMRESRRARRLRHPNIVSILDFDMTPAGNPFLVMELLNGPSLQEEIAQRGALDVADVQRIMPPLCAALQLAHASRHRPSRPEAGQHRRARVHARASASTRWSTSAWPTSASRPTTTRLTGPHQFIGTMTYASPEQLSAAAVDARSDVYSLGAVVFEMLTGELPFAADDIRDAW